LSLIQNYLKLRMGLILLYYFIGRKLNILFYFLVKLLLNVFLLILIVVFFMKRLF